MSACDEVIAQSTMYEMLAHCDVIYLINNVLTGEIHWKHGTNGRQLYDVLLLLSVLRLMTS
jgi:hypothetical protein